MLIDAGSVITTTADGCVIKGFVIEHSGGELSREDSGILLKSSNNRIEDNELRDILYGIYFYSSHHNTIRRNHIRGRRELEEGDRGAGLHLWNSPSNIIEDNTFSEMRDGLYVQLRRECLHGKQLCRQPESAAIDWAKHDDEMIREGRGNFWSDYDGYDLNEDGRGDVPVKIQNVFEYLEGNHPRLRLFLDSPAARAMAVAEKTFP